MIPVLQVAVEISEPKSSHERKLRPSADVLLASSHISLAHRWRNTAESSLAGSEGFSMLACISVNSGKVGSAIASSVETVLVDDTPADKVPSRPTSAESPTAGLTGTYSHAAKVITLGRSTDKTKAATAELRQEARSMNQKAEVIGLAVDISNASAVEKLWAGLKEQGTVVNVLVLNAASISLRKPVLELGTEGLWCGFNMNVRAQFDMVERFYKQEDKPIDKPLNTAAKHHGYGASKLAGATVLQMIALETSPEEMQVVNFHPGPNYTQAAKDAGYSREDFDWHDENLSGQFAVWLASPEAKFLHGRFVWVSWDVDELKSGGLRKRIDEDELFLKTGVRGL
ncbi:hypothetical protein DL766_000547 [Monosporascus sp. MC13-8B]|uniref:Uncharacterized protein n=1 Tax=Monosporascus cannonballus TaxID=155416 RepID=A0ABY0H6F6_9PEZI|nr:hypothetical protein DL762_004893 [Monosporascus cannonballus]RYO90900.1 hypothetical protein DL763_005169 [Monosporascus cannonballus]RYP39177.1 hypothetical protein DL766_000547 [Monosporascus sp. MC13-8B]